MRPRSSPRLFERALGLKGCCAREPELGKWTALAESGLFSNLSSTLTAHKCPHQRKLTVFGKELPSVRVTPEFSVGSSFTNPDIEGRVRIVDRNFCGLGQLVDLCASWSRPASVSGNSTALNWPRLDVAWTDMTIGRKGHVSAGLSVQETIGQPTELDKQFSRYLASFPASSSRLTLRPSPNKAVQSRLWLNSHRSYASNGAAVAVDAEAYMSQTLPTSRFAGASWGSRSGVKLLVDVCKNGLRALGKYDAGMVATTRPQRKLPYHLFDVTLKTALFAMSLGAGFPHEKATAMKIMAKTTPTRRSKPPVRREVPPLDEPSAAVRCFGDMCIRLSSSWGEGHREVPVESVSKTVTRGIFPCNSSMGSAPADIKEPFKYAGSVKVSAHLAGLSRFVRPGVFAESLISGQQHRLRWSRSQMEAITPAARATDDTASVFNRWGLFVKVFNGLRADISWKLGEDVNKCILSLESDVD